MPPILKRIVFATISLPALYILWLLLRMTCFDYFTIPSESMYPTLKPGDQVVVNKLLLGARIYKDLHFSKKGQQLNSWRLKGIRSVQWNDICVFNYPKHKNKISFVINDVYCKRCIGLPGDSIWIEDGFYKNNNYKYPLGLEDEQVKLSHIPDSLFSTKKLQGKKLGWTVHDFGPLYIPRKGDIVEITPREAILYKQLLQWETGGTIQWDAETGAVTLNKEPFLDHTFQHNYYFMAGDNVCDSNDSRYWGLVPEDYIIGIVQWIL